MGSGNLEMSLPPVSSYLISITIGALPKFFLIVSSLMYVDSTLA